MNVRILNLEQFRAKPENTVFSKYEPYLFGELQIKGQTLEADFLAQSINGAIESNDTGDFCDKLDRAQKTAEYLKMDFNCECRDGLFKKDQLFAVWEEADVRALIQRLQWCLPLQ